MKIPDFVLSWVLLLALAAFILAVTWSPVLVSMITIIILIILGFLTLHKWGSD